MISEIIEASTTLTFIKDLESRFLYANHIFCKLLPITGVEEILGRNDSELPWKTGQGEYFMAMDQALIKTGKLPVYSQIANDKIIYGSKELVYSKEQQQQVIFGHFKIMPTIEFPTENILIKAITGNLNELFGNQRHFKISMPHPVNLSLREAQCLLLTIAGKTAQQIADKLCISKRTVEAHMLSARTKMDCDSKSEMIEKAICAGFLNFFNPIQAAI